MLATLEKEKRFIDKTRATIRNRVENDISPENKRKILHFNKNH